MTEKTHDDDREKMKAHANAAEIPSSKALQDDALTGEKSLKEKARETKRNLSDKIPTESIEGRLGKDPKA